MSKIAAIIASDFEDSELKVPVDRLEAAGHEVTYIGTKSGETLKGKKGEFEVTTETSIDRVHPSNFDALLIAGGYSPDKLRLSRPMVKFTADFVKSGKPVAAICHGPQLLIEAEVVRGRTMTSWPSVRKDLENAGAVWKDESVIVDTNLITSRKPDDLDDFCNALLEQLEAVQKKVANA